MRKLSTHSRAEFVLRRIYGVSDLSAWALTNEEGEDHNKVAVYVELDGVNHLDFTIPAYLAQKLAHELEQAVAEIRNNTN